MAAETETTAPTVEGAAANDAATAGQHTATTEHAAAEAGLPQFQFQHWAGQIGYLLILFAILYVLMARVFIPRMRAVFDQRATTISDALAAARSVQAEAAAQAEAAKQALVEARANAQRTATEAKAKAAQEASSRQKALETELNAKLSEAEARIRASRDQALGQVRGIAAETAAAITEKLTGQASSEEAISAAFATLQG